MTLRSNGFVAEGRERWMATDEYRRLAREAEEQVRRRYAADLAAAGLAKWLWLRLRCELEVRRELEMLAPVDADYLTHPEAGAGKHRS